MLHMDALFNSMLPLGKVLRDGVMLSLARILFHFLKL